MRVRSRSAATALHHAIKTIAQQSANMQWKIAKDLTPLDLATKNYFTGMADFVSRR